MARTPRPVITSEDFATLEPEWAALHGAVPGVSPFAHPAWQATWLRHFGSVARDGYAPAPAYLAVRIEEQLGGVVPIDAGAGGVARFLGDPDVCDYAGILCATGAEQALARGTLEWLMEDMTPGFDAWGLVQGSPLHGAFVDAADYWGWRLEEEVESVAPGVDLPATFDAFVAGLGKHDRHELRRKLRNLEAAGPVELVTVRDAEESDSAVTRLIEMMRASRQDKDEFLTPRMEGYFRDLAGTFCGLGMARLQSLLVDGRPVATIFAFDCGGQRYLYNSGYDPDWATKAAGLLSKALSLRDAIECGLGRFDFLRGDERYKLQLGGVPGTIVTLHLRR